MLQFAMAGTVPPGGVFFYSDPANGVPLLQDKNGFEPLISKVRAAYASAGKPTPEPLARVVEEYICNHVPRGFCLGTYLSHPPDYMTPQAVQSRSLAVSSTGRVDPGTALSRMKICGSCPKNSKAICLSCTGLTDWAVRLAGRTKIGMDDALGICLCDRILISLLVSLNLPVVTPDDHPSACWRTHE